MELFISLYLICSVFLCWETEGCETDSHNEKIKRFGESLGKPNIYYDEQKNLVLKVTIYKGHSNRVLDSGIHSVGIQLENINEFDLNENLVNYLSQVLDIDKRLFTMIPGQESFHKTVKIRGSTMGPYDVVDRLVAALEVTAREEPKALSVTDPSVPHSEIAGAKDQSRQEEDPVRIFDWTNKKF